MFIYLKKISCKPYYITTMVLFFYLTYPITMTNLRNQEKKKQKQTDTVTRRWHWPVLFRSRLNAATYCRCSLYQKIISLIIVSETQFISKLSWYFLICIVVNFIFVQLLNERTKYTQHRRHSAAYIRQLNGVVYFILYTKSHS